MHSISIKNIKDHRVFHHYYNLILLYVFLGYFFSNVMKNYLNICHFSVVCANELVSLILRRRRNRGGDQRNCVRLSIGISSHNGHRGHDDPISSFLAKKTAQQSHSNLANLISTRSPSRRFARVKALSLALAAIKGGPQTASLTSLRPYLTISTGDEVVYFILMKF